MPFLYSQWVLTHFMEDLDKKWNALLTQLGRILGKRPGNLNSVLFLIGVQELGKGPLNFSKEQKQDLMHIATCKLLSYEGFYELEGIDQDGWPHWNKKSDLPSLTLNEQELLLKQNAITYFNELLNENNNL